MYLTSPVWSGLLSGRFVTGNSQPGRSLHLSAILGDRGGVAPFASWASYWEGFPGSSDRISESACNAGDLGLIPGSGRSPGEGNGSHTGILAWRIPWTGEPGGLWSMGSQRVRRNWVWAQVASHTSELLCLFTPVPQMSRGSRWCVSCLSASWSQQSSHALH